VELYLAAGQPLKALPDGRIAHDDGEICLESTIAPIKDRRGFISAKVQLRLRFGVALM